MVTVPPPTRSRLWMTDEHSAWADAVRQFLADELVPRAEGWREQGYVDASFWPRAGDMGILGATIPEAYGGTGAPYSFDAITLEELAKTGSNGWGFAVQSIVAHYIISYGTDAQKASLLPRMASGEIIAAIAMTEPNTGSDLQAITTVAETDGDEYRITGNKTFITNGQTANLVVVVAKTDRTQPGSRGISLILVETDHVQGFTRGRNLEKMGLKDADTSELSFEDVRVPRENVLGGAEGLGFKQLMMQLPWERLMIAIGAVGAMEFALAHTIAYTRERRAFKQRIFDFQNTRFQLAEAKTKLEVTRAFVDDCIKKLDQGRLDAVTASMAKYWASEMQCEVVDACLQLFGGYGYMTEYPISRAYADARVQKIYGGTTEIMKELIARSLDADS